MFHNIFFTSKTVLYDNLYVYLAIVQRNFSKIDYMKSYNNNKA